MQLDRTRIAIRERSLFDIIDLSLRVIASYPWQWLGSLAVFALPCICINVWLVGWMPGTAEEPGAVARYLWNMFALIFVEAPFASAVVTLFFGQAMFMDQPNAKDMFHVLRRYGLNLCWCQLIRRAVLPAWLLLAFVPRDSVWSGQETSLVFLVLYLGLVRSVRPYLNEIILLERNPLRSSADYQMTIARRSSSLHNPNAGDLLARWLGVSIAAVCIWLSLFGSVWCVITQLVLNLDDTFWGLHVAIPCGAWLVVGFVAVVRFLCYLDLRIRREGWEVELIVRSAVPFIQGGPNR